MSTPTAFSMPSKIDVLKMNNVDDDDDLGDLDESLFGAEKTRATTHESQRVPSSDGLTFPQWFAKYARGLPGTSFMKKLQARTAKDKQMPVKGSLKDFHTHFVRRRQQKRDSKLIKALEKAYSLFLPFKKWLMGHNSNNEEVKKFQAWVTKNAGFPDTGTYEAYKNYLMTMNAGPDALKQLVLVYKIYNRHENFVPFDFMKDHVSSAEVRLSRDQRQSLSSKSSEALATGFGELDLSSDNKAESKSANTFETGFADDDEMFEDDMFDDDDDMFADDDMYGEDDEDDDYGPGDEDKEGGEDDEDFYGDDGDDDDFFDDI